MSSSKKRITVIGAGPVGSLLSIYLAKRGHDVEVYERRPDMRQTDISAGRSINLAISDRGLKAVEGVGLLDEVMDMTIPMRGRRMHSADSELSFHQYGTEGQAIHSISRGGLNALLMTKAEEDNGVKFHFNEQCTDLDLDKPEAHFTNTETGAETKINPDIIFGADGAFSVVRAKMQKTDRFNYSQDYLDHGYKELVIPPTENGGWRIEKEALHIWPRRSFMLIALPNLDGSFTVTLFLAYEGEFSFEALNSDEEIMKFFEEQFPDALEHMPTLISDYHENPTSSLAIIRCFPWVHEDKIALIGDASHAIVPFYGQGMNAGMEDCTILDQLMDEHGDDWSALLDAFQVSRKPNGDAIADLALKNFIEMRDKVADADFIRRKKIERIITETFPGKFLNQYMMVTFSHIPYYDSWVKGNQQDDVMKKIMAIDNVEDRLDEPEIREQVLALLSELEAAEA